MKCFYVFYIYICLSVVRKSILKHHCLFFMSETLIGPSVFFFPRPFYRDGYRSGCGEFP